jgi:sugar lactone lactonase YvrE
VADGSGNIYVNYLNHVYKYDANGKVLGQVGDKKLDHYSIALDKSGNLYAVVTDSTLLKYDSQGNVVAKLQVNQNKKKTDQLQPGEFDYNSFVRVDPAGNIYLFEQYYQKRVQKFSPDMKFVGLLETPKDASGKPSDVVDITFDKDSNPIVVNSKHLWKFDGAGKLVSDTPTDLSYYPKRLIALADGTFFLVGDVARTGKVDQSGKLLQPVGASNRTQPGQFESADAVVADANGNFYVADGYQNRIQKFDRNGKLLLTIDQKLVGQALSAYYMALDKSGNLYVAGSDRAFGSADRVLKLSPEGKLLATIGKKGDADGQFQSTSGLVLDNKGNLYVGDEKKGVIQKFGPDGAFIEKYAVKEKDTDKLYHMSMAFDSAGNLYVAGIENKGVLILGPDGKTKGFMDNKEVKDASVFSIYIDAKDTRYILTRGGFGTGAVVMLDKDGQLVKKFQGEGSNVLQFKNPSSLTVDAAGNIYVTEWDNARIQRWNPGDTSLKPGDPLPGTK